MTISLQILLVVSIALLLYVTPLTLSYSTTNYYIIRDSKTNYVLQALNTNNVSVEEYDGYASQLWRFETGTRPGLFFIINSSNNNVLDIDQNTLTFNRSNVIVNTKGYSIYQQWYINSNGSIVNARLNERISTSECSEGLGLQVGLDTLRYQCDNYIIEDGVFARR